VTLRISVFQIKNQSNQCSSAFICVLILKSVFLPARHVGDAALRLETDPVLVRWAVKVVDLGLVQCDVGGGCINVAGYDFVN
jgi:hypothetical protein